MGMPEPDCKEALGMAYVRAIIAKAGYNIAKSEKDFGLDGTIRDVKDRNGRRYESGIGIEFQLKSSCDVSFENGELVYDLESKNYNDLALWAGAMPSILILFVLPEDANEWIKHSKECLEIRNCAWWCSLQGLPETPNSSTKRIRIPEEQVFSPDMLKYLMEKARKGDDL